MNADDMARVLAKAALFDRRTGGESEIAAWLEVAGDLDVDDALEAVGAHYRTSTDWLMPSTLRERVYDIAAERRRLAAIDRARRVEAEQGEREIGRTPETDARLEALRQMLAERYDINGTMREAAAARRARFQAAPPRAS